MSQSEIRNCQNCKTDFTIEPEDFIFYERIKTLPPTFCSECRRQRRFTWRNERSLYHSKCSGTGKDIISMFDPENKLVVYNKEHWWSDNWDQMESGRDYDFSKPFFVQFRELLEKAPLPCLANSNAINSDYGNHNADVKDCYLTFASYTDERISYSTGCVESKDSLDLYKCSQAEKCYDDTFCTGVFNTLHSRDSVECHNSRFLGWCRNVSDSLGCINLRSQKNCIFNEQYSKEDYEKKLKEFDLGSYKNLQEFEERFEKFSKKHPRRFANILKSQDVTGDNIITSKNVKDSFDALGDCEDSRFLFHTKMLKDSYDCYGAGGGAELLYEVIDTGVSANNNLFVVFTHRCQEVRYSYACHSSSNLFGCVGLKSKQYCILNKQYSKEEYNKFLPKIIQHMKDMPYEDKKKRRYAYGEFFPAELSPFAYNETVAQEYYPLTKSQVIEKGYKYKEVEKKVHSITKKTEELPDHIKDVDESILKEVIECEHKGECTHQCTYAYKIIPLELEFYKNLGIPLPRMCHNCRHYKRLEKRNPLKLWDRECLKCNIKVKTPYSPEREEIIYCEDCYQKEVV